MLTKHSVRIYIFDCQIPMIHMIPRHLKIFYRACIFSWTWKDYRCCCGCHRQTRTKSLSKKWIWQRKVNFYRNVFESFQKVKLVGSWKNILKRNILNSATSTWTRNENIGTIGCNRPKTTFYFLHCSTRLQKYLTVKVFPSLPR